LYLHQDGTGLAPGPPMPCTASSKIRPGFAAVRFFFSV